MMTVIKALLKLLKYFIIVKVCQILSVRILLCQFSILEYKSSVGTIIIFNFVELAN